MADQELKILITADSTKANDVLDAVERRVEKFASRISAILSEINNNNSSSTVNITVDRSSIDSVISSINKLKKGTNVNIKFSADTKTLKNATDSVAKSVKTASDAISETRTSQITDLAVVYNDVSISAQNAASNISEIARQTSSINSVSSIADALKGVFLECGRSVKEANAIMKAFALALSSTTSSASGSLSAVTDKTGELASGFSRLISSAEGLGSIPEINPYSVSSIDLFIEKIVQAYMALQQLLSSQKQLATVNVTPPKDTGIVPYQAAKSELDAAREYREQREQFREEFIEGVEYTAYTYPDFEPPEGYSDIPDPSIFDRIRDAVQRIVGVVSSIPAIISTIIDAISSVASALAPVIAVVRTIITILRGVLTVVYEIVKAAAQFYMFLAKAGAVSIGGILKGLGASLSAIGKLTASVAKVVGSAFTAPVKFILNGIENIYNKIKNLWHRIKNMLSRVLIRKAINAFITTISEGFDAITSKSKQAANDLGMLKGALRGVGASIANAFTPVIAAAANTLYNFASAVVAAMNALAAFFGTLFGTSYSVVTLTNAMDDLGNATGGAGSKAKGALADFDELNVIAKNSGGGGGGGGVSNGFDISTVDPNSAFSKLGKLIREGIENGDLEAAGRYLNSWAKGVFENLLETIRGWDSEKVGTEIATFINGITFDSSTFETLGRVIAAALGKMLSGIDAFLKKVDGIQLGNAIVKFINGITLEDALDTLAKTIKDFIVLECTVAATLFDGNNAVNLAAKIINVINDLLSDQVLWKSLGHTISGMVEWGFSQAAALLAGISKEDLQNAITDLLDSLKLGKTLSNLADSVKTIVLSAVDLAAVALSQENITSVTTAIANAINKLFSNDEGQFNQLGTNLGNILNNTVKGITSGIKQVTWADIGASIGSALQSLVITFDAKAFGEMLSGLITGAIELIAGKDGKGGLLSVSEETLSGIGDKISDFLTGIQPKALGKEFGEFCKNLLVTAIETATTLLNGTSDGGGIADGIISFISAINFSDKEIEKISNFGKSIHDTIVKVLDVLFGADDSTTSGNGLVAGINAFLNGLQFNDAELETLKNSLATLLETAFRFAWDVAKTALNNLIFGDSIDMSGAKIEVTAEDFEFNFDVDADELVSEYRFALDKALKNGSVTLTESGDFYAMIHASLEKGDSWDHAVENALNYISYLREHPEASYMEFLASTQADDDTKALFGIMGSTTGGGTSGGTVNGYPVKMNVTSIADTDSELILKWAREKQQNELGTTVVVGTKQGTTWSEKAYSALVAAKSMADDFIKKSISVMFGEGSATASEINTVGTGLKAISGVKDSSLKKTVTTTQKGMSSSMMDKVTGIFKLSDGQPATKEVAVKSNITQESVTDIKNATTAVNSFYKSKSSTKTITANVSGMANAEKLSNFFSKVQSKTAELTVGLKEDTSLDTIFDKYNKFKTMNDSSVSMKASVSYNGKDSVEKALGLTNLKAEVSLSGANSFAESVKKAINGIKFKARVDAKGDVKLELAALGGAFGAGTLIMAGEAGPEVIGNLGGGNTGVMNMRQMSDAVSNGVANANATQNGYLKELIKIGTALLGKDLVISPSVELGQVVARSEALYGKV